MTNSLPHNFQILGTIKLLFPNAKIISVKRNPIDNCLFCFIKKFKNQHNYSCDLPTMEYYYREYTRFMSHWTELFGDDIYAISFEDLVSRPTEVLRGVFDYLRIPDAEQAVRAPITAGWGTFEVGRASEPVNRSYIGYWRNYERHLQPLIDALGDLAVDGRSRPN